MTIAVTLTYFVLLLAIGGWAARRTRSSHDFYVGGRRFGLFAIALATMSSAMSGFVFIGGPALQYKLGFGTLLLTLPAAVSFALAWYVLGKRLTLMARTHDILTIPDAIFVRFNSNAARGLSAVAILLGVLGYLATQTLAMGVVLASVFELSLTHGVLLGVLMVTLYSVAGGMIAGVYTDVLQAGVMLIAALGGCYLALESGGGLGNMISTIAAKVPDYVSPWGTVPASLALAWYLVFSLGILGQPQVAHKFLMLRDPRLLRWGAVVAAVTAIIASFIWLGIGTATQFLDTQQALANSADNVAPWFMLNYAPPFLAGLFFAGVAAAAMSTADSFLNIGAAAIVRDLPLALGKTPKPQWELRAGQGVTVLLAISAGVIAIVSGEFVAILGMLGWSTFAAALMPSLGLGLNWARATRKAAIASISCGLGLQIVLECYARFELGPPLPAHIYRAALALLVSLLVFIVVSFFSTNSHRFKA